MCANFRLKLDRKEFELVYGIEDMPDDLPFEWNVLPHQPGLVIINRRDTSKDTSGHAPELTTMNFSLIPSWSKDKRPKFATHNARLETLAEKPTWKGPLATHRCLVPMTSFVEPIYTNKFAGNMVEFSANKGDLLTAAGLWSEWKDHKTGEIIESFTIITDDPPEFIGNTGHDRCPIFLEPASFSKWIEPKKRNVIDAIAFLKDQSVQNKIAFSAAVDRPMKAGWEKRVPKDAP